ncbi:MAG TPA: hypothetical protein ENL03_02400 [Phycisphaerae bacterium]|nr:hypothetical protein [Phycisphaerae bacterium]
MILIYPECAWEELVPEDSLQCVNDRLRAIEKGFRRTIYTHEHFVCDTVVTREFGVEKVVNYTDLGLEPEWDHSTAARGTKGFHPILLKRSDLKKLRMQDVSYDEDTTEKHLIQMQDMLGDILDVRLRGHCYIRFQPMQQYTALRGLSEAMMDMALEPEFVHDAMAFFTEVQKIS